MNEEKFSVNDGDEVKQISVESKEATLEATPAEMGKPEAPVVLKKKRGRPARSTTVTSAKVEDKKMQDFYCSTCRERFTDLTVTKMAAGTDRYAAFCPNCTKFLTYVDEVMQLTIKSWIDNNPTK